LQHVEDLTGELLPVFRIVGGANIILAKYDLVREHFQLSNKSKRLLPMSNYVWGSSLSHHDYLQAKSFVSDVQSATRNAAKKVSMDISRQTRDIIASNESLQREHLELLNASTDRTVSALNDGFERISYNMDAGFDRMSSGLDQISSSISELNATFHWGFGAVLASIGHMNDTLSELVKIAKTPVQTVAFNHFEIARDAFRKRLYRESLEELDKAIFGDHTSAGYKLEWRFHQMKGTLQLGFADCDMSLYDLAKAEESFLTAARYGETDYPHDAGRSFLSAGWAAYCQGKMKQALAHTEQAMALHPDIGEVFFQASKVHMALGDVASALPMLAKAIDIDRFYALKAAGDGDFQQHDAQLRSFLEALRKEKYKQSVPKVKAVLDRIKGFELAPGIAGSVELKQLQAFLSEGANWPLIDMLNVVQTLDSVLNIFDNLLDGFISAVIDSSARLPIVVSVEEAGPPVNTKEKYTEQETYYEDVVITPGGFFKKAVTEKQQKTRMVTKTRTVTTSSSGKEITHFEFCPIFTGTLRMKWNNTKIDPDFFLGKYPVTQQQWEAVMGNNPSKLKGGSLPVEPVSFDDAQIFIQKLNQLSGKQCYRLPTEEEWEYACRAGSTSNYFFGDDASKMGEYAWYDDNAGGTTHPVGQKRPNAWGFYDMAGNVWEWADSWYDRSRTERVIRGGNWACCATGSASRGRCEPGKYGWGWGFRLVYVP
jgi:formylglycine-generating enzyme required for sulfatase activity